MNRPASRLFSTGEILAGYALAAITLCGGFYLSRKVPEGPTATLFVRGSWWLTLAIVVNFTFAWGRVRDFPLRREDGEVSLTNLARNLVASAIVLFAVVWISGPIIGALVRSAR